MKKFSIILFIVSIFLTFFFTSCNKSKKQINKNNDIENYYRLSESLQNVNKQLVAKENELIENFISKNKLRFKKTGTGLRYLIYENGNGEKAKKNKIAKINYNISFLNGDLCYSSKNKGPIEFRIGRGSVVTGLEQGILLLKVGDSAKFIIPSHLAFGLVGDQDKIPAKATLVYDIELIELK